MRPLRWLRPYGRNWLTHLRRRAAERHRAPAGRRAFVTFGERRPTRYDFLLLKHLSLSGYDVILAHGRSVLAAHGDYAELIFAIPGLRIASTQPRDASLLIDLSGRHAATSPARADRRGKAVTVDLAAFSDEARRPGALHAPFPMHPLVYVLGLDRELPALRTACRGIRVLFAGNQDDAAYAPASMARFGLVSRRALLAHVRAELGPTESSDVRDAAALRPEADGYDRRVLLVDTARSWIPRERWLETLATADFFLAAPGVAMPFCHNVVEALAVGTIPITEYGELFPVPLEDGKTCISFRGRADLIDKLRAVLALDPPRILEMRRAVVRYYDEHLAPENLRRRLEAAEGDAVTLYMVAEHETVQRHAAVLREPLVRGVP